jgi:hypothetical protein
VSLLLRFVAPLKKNSFITDFNLMSKLKDIVQLTDGYDIQDTINSTVIIV